MTTTYGLGQWSLGIAILSAATAFAAQSAEIASPWSVGKPETKARLLAGQIAGRPMAAVEIQLAEGWKTYWRFPGDAGGVPPMFDWSKSDNVASIKVLYPQPKRFVEKGGDTLGYKSSAIFPVIVEPKDASKPVALKVLAEYGICRDVCIPVEAELAIDVPASGAAALTQDVANALEQVPREAAARRAQDPKLLKIEAKLEGPHPSLAIEAEFPGGTSKADAYVESPAGYYIPLPKAGSAKSIGPDKLRFEIDLTDAVDPADIKGKDAKVTLVSERGLSEATFNIQ